MERLLYIDPSMAGISGNMILSALVDLGADERELERLAQVASSTMKWSMHLVKKRVKRWGFGALWLDWEVDRRQEDIPAAVFLSNIEKIAEEMGLQGRAKDFAVSTGKVLVEAEAAVHDETPADVVFHELGFQDTVLDIVGTASLANNLHLFSDDVTVYSAPVALGEGTVEVRHGHLSIPPFVTAQLLRMYKIPFRFSPAKGELATPTGVALLGNLVDTFDRSFVLVPESIGYGAGTAELEGIPNILRIMVGTRYTSRADFVSVLETNVDDVTGEVLGYTSERLLEHGALDVQIIPTLGKKGRPAHIVQVISKPQDEERLAAILMKETGSLGVRTSLERRHVFQRETINMRSPFSGYKKEIKVKVGRDERGEIATIKPEYEDARRISEATGLSLREVTAELERIAKKEFSKRRRGAKKGRKA